MSRGLFVSFEGPEGAGKTTQVELLAELLRRQGRAVLAVREPGGTPLGERVRDMLLTSPDLGITPEAELLLFCAARAQLVSRVIRPALAEGTTVLADRFSDSTRAYQGGGRGLHPLAVSNVLSFATGGLEPDLTFLLDVPVVAGLGRRRTSGHALNRMDREAVDYHERVWRAFHELAAAEPERWCVLNAQQPIAELAAQIAVCVQCRLEAPE